MLYYRTRSDGIDVVRMLHASRETPFLF